MTSQINPNKLVIFGTGKIAELAHYYFENDSTYEVAGFCVEAEYINSGEFKELPLIDFENISQVFPPAEFSLFVAISYSGLNSIRKRIYEEGKAKGYKMASYISSKATILNDNCFGDNCFILEDNTIQPYSEIGNNVFIWSGNHIGHHSCIGDHIFISSHVVISGGVVLEDECFIGVNSTIRDHVTIGRQCIIGAGSLILKDAEQKGLYVEKATEVSKIPSTRLKNF